MAVAMLAKKKLKNRSRQRQPEEEDEDMVIISRLEMEPWQPDLLLERQSDRCNNNNNNNNSNPNNNINNLSDQRYMAHQTQIFSPLTSLRATTTLDSTIANNEGSSTISGDNNVQSSGFQGVIPIIVKSPSSIITTTDSDCVESIFEDHAPKIPGIEEYLQQTHQQQQLLQQQQQEIQKQMQSQLQLQYQPPAHLQINNLNSGILESQQPPSPPQRQQQFLRQQNYRYSFHGHSGNSLLSMEERPILQSRPLSAHESDTGSTSPVEKVMSDNEDVIESLQSLKNLTMLALDGLLQQVVSGVTASDPVHNPDETTLQARALIRRSSISLLDFVGQGQQLNLQPQQQKQRLNDAILSSDQYGNVYRDEIPKHPIQNSISDTPIAGMAASSFERLDELTRKVDQLTAAANNENQQQRQLTNNIVSSNKAREIPHEPLDVSQQQQQQQIVRMDPSKVFESQEYQLACALAAMLACIYRILNQMQEPRMPQRTESVDSGLDQASRLWKRLSSNTFVRNNNQSSIPSTISYPSSIAAPQSRESTTATSSLPLLPEERASTIENGTTGFIQSINKQVRTLRSRRSQSTSYIEVSNNTKSLQGRFLGGLGLSSPGNKAIKNQSLHPRDAARMENTKEMEREWLELDKLMDEMGHLWRFVECTEDIEDSEATEDDDPFHDRNEIQQPPQQTSTVSSIAANTLSTIAATRSFDQQTLDMAAVNEELPKYEDQVPQYKFLEKTPQPAETTSLQTQSRASTNANGLLTGNSDEKTRFDLNNVMSAIERLSKVAPRLDNQRVQLTASQRRQMAQASVDNTNKQLSKDRSRLDSTSIASSSTQKSAKQQRLAAEKTRDLNKLINQIVESAAKATNYTAQRAELSPRQQWKLEGARVGDKIERGERLRMSDQ
ncbi:hypothetical protein BGZ46_009410, partial [Entomortierella lignicola]